MAFSYAPDFVIKQKRKRSWKAVDPCLGYYLEVASPPETTSATPAFEPGSLLTESPDVHSHLDTPPTGRPVKVELPPIATIEDVSPPEIPQLHDHVPDQSAQITVEEFLRRAADQSPKRYVYRKRKRARRVDYSDTENDDAPIVSRRRTRRRATALPPSSDSIEVFKSSSPQNKPRVKRRTIEVNEEAFSRRLLHAAMISHVEPGDALLDMRDETHITTTVPLKLLPVDDTNTSTPHTVPPKWKLVDPRTCAPFKTMASGFRTSGHQSPPKQRSRSSHQRTLQDMSHHVLSGVLRQLPKPKPSITRRKKQTLNALTFVPLKEHEAQLEKVFPRSGRMGKVSHRPVHDDGTQPMVFHFAPLVFEEVHMPPRSRREQITAADGDISQAPVKASSSQRSGVSAPHVIPEGVHSPRMQTPTNAGAPVSATRLSSIQSSADSTGRSCEVPTCEALNVNSTFDITLLPSPSELRHALDSSMSLSNLQTTAQSNGSIGIDVAAYLGTSRPSTLSAGATNIKQRADDSAKSQKKTLRPLESYLDFFQETARKASRLEPGIAAPSNHTLKNSQVQKPAGHQLSRFSQTFRKPLHDSEDHFARDDSSLLISDFSSPPPSPGIHSKPSNMSVISRNQSRDHGLAPSSSHNAQPASRKSGYKERAPTANEGLDILAQLRMHSSSIILSCSPPQDEPHSVIKYEDIQDPSDTLDNAVDFFAGLR